jgi:2-oxoglutarate dehydrogenase E2 component (dihydrolipoamide succinyltransferase)
MSKPIIIPPAGESVKSGQIAKWHFKDGEFVKKGALILTVDTDKVATEVLAEVSGVLKHAAKEGDDVDIGATVGSIDESAAEPAASAPAPAAPVPAVVTPAATPAAPVAVQKPAPVAAAPAPVRVVSPEGRETRKRMSPLRKKIAEQLVSAQQTAALLTTFNEADMSAVMALRSSLQDSFVAKHGLKLGFMSFFVKAVVEALKAVPQINVRVEGDEIVSQHFYDIGVAVGTERGLVVPVIRDADQKSFADIERDILGYAAKAKAGQLSLADLTGGVFTISNGGVYGSLLSTPIINPPQSAILGMHSIQQRPMAVDGQVVVRPMMYLAMTYDHRVVDGKEAVTFLIRVKECIENPARLLLGA